jgi:hypothetical protein
MDQAPYCLVVGAASRPSSQRPPEPFRLTRDDRASKSRGALLCQAVDDIRDGSPYYMSRSCFA